MDEQIKRKAEAEAGTGSLDPTDPKKQKLEKEEKKAEPLVKLWTRFNPKLTHDTYNHTSVNGEFDVNVEFWKVLKSADSTTLDYPLPIGHAFSVTARKRREDAWMVDASQGCKVLMRDGEWRTTHTYYAVDLPTEGDYVIFSIKTTVTRSYNVAEQTSTWARHSMFFRNDFNEEIARGPCRIRGHGYVQTVTTLFPYQVEHNAPMLACAMRKAIAARVDEKEVNITDIDDPDNEACDLIDESRRLLAEEPPEVVLGDNDTDEWAVRVLLDVVVSGAFYEWFKLGADKELMFNVDHLPSFLTLCNQWLVSDAKTGPSFSPLYYGIRARMRAYGQSLSKPTDICKLLAAITAAGITTEANACNALHNALERVEFVQ